MKEKIKNALETKKSRKGKEEDNVLGLIIKEPIFIDTCTQIFINMSSVSSVPLPCVFCVHDINFYIAWSSAAICSKPENRGAAAS